MANSSVTVASAAPLEGQNDVQMDAQERLTVINESVKKIDVKRLSKDVDSAIKKAASEMRKKLDGFAKSSLHVKKLQVNIEELKGGVIPAGFKKFALPFESVEFHEPLQGDRQVAYVLPHNCSIAEAKRIAYGEFLATSNAWDFLVEKSDVKD